MRLPKQIEGIVFKEEENKIKFLLLKRIESRGGFWQFITGGVEDYDKSLKNSLIRELKEELNLDEEDILRILENLGTFEFEAKLNNKNQIIKEYVFGIKINPQSKITIDKNEHEKLIWTNYEEALSLLKFENNKKALELLKKNF